MFYRFLAKPSFLAFLNYSQARVVLSQGLRYESEKWTYPFSGYRLERISEILRMSFDDPESLLWLNLILHLK